MDAEKVKYWSDISDYDLDTADAMLRTGRWLLCRVYVSSGGGKNFQGVLVQQEG